MITPNQLAQQQHPAAKTNTSFHLYWWHFYFSCGYGANPDGILIPHLKKACELTMHNQHSLMWLFFFAYF